MEMQDAMAFLSALQILHQPGSSQLGSPAPLPHLALPPAVMEQQQVVVDVNQLLLLSAAHYPGALHLSVPFPPFGLPPRASATPAAFAPATPTVTAAAPAPGPTHQSQATAKRSRRRVSMTTPPATQMPSPKTTSHAKMDINFLTTPTECHDHSFDFGGAGAVVEWSSPLSSPRLGRSWGEESPLPPSPPAGRADHHHQAGDGVVQLAAEEAKERWREREESMVSLKHTHKAIAANRQAQHNQDQKRRRMDQQPSSSSSSSGSSGSSQEDEDEESDGGHDAAGGGREPRVMTGRTCMHCGITSTPEWRTGPDGKGTLCNACGLRYRKFVRAEEKRGVVIAFPAMPALAKPRKRRRPAGQSDCQPDGGGESALVLMDPDHAHKEKKKRKATAS